jgi:3-phenylpropionate/trans-cinnamate dioxygenase ferredoxin reductase component
MRPDLISGRDSRVIALDCVNATKDYVQGRSLLRSSRLIGTEALADTSVPLKALA